MAGWIRRASGYLVTQAGTYSVVVDLGGCTTNDVIEVDYLSPGSVDLGPDASICPGSTLLLDATTSGASYLWQNGSTGPTFNASGTGQYWVQVSLGGCSESDSIDVIRYATAGGRTGTGHDALQWRDDPLGSHAWHRERALVRWQHVVRSLR